MTGMHIHVFGGHPSMNLTPRVAHLSACAPRVTIQPILLTAVRPACCTFHTREIITSIIYFGHNGKRRRADFLQSFYTASKAV